MQLGEARRIAEMVVRLLVPWCERIEIGGSIRREKPEVKDIEIICIPRRKDVLQPVEADLFGVVADVAGKLKCCSVPVPDFVRVVERYEKVKGEAWGKYTQRRLPEGINLDLFMCERDNWGAIFLIRTGDWRYSKWFMGSALRRAGYEQKDGYVWRGEHRFAVPEEADMFRLAGVPYLEPKFRTR